MSEGNYFTQDELVRLYNTVRHQIDQDFTNLLVGGLSTQVSREAMDRIQELVVIKYKLDLLIENV